MMLRRLLNKGICATLIISMLLMTGCLNSKSTSIDKDVIIDNIMDNSSSVLNDVTAIEDSQVKSVEVNQSFDGNIELKNDSINFSGNGVTVNGSTVTITQAGTYVVSGKLDDGQIIVDADKSSTVNLVLNGANINCSNNSAIYSKQAKETKITILNGSINKVTDGSEYNVDSNDTDAPTACIFSQDDLTIEGTGTLYVSGNYNDAITSKDILTVNEGVILISSVDEGMIGRDAVIIKNGDIKIICEGDGIKSTNDEDTAKGYITIDNGIFNITSGTDGIQAETDLTINDGSFTIVTGGGSENSSTKTDNMGGFNNWGAWGKRPDNNMQMPSGDINNQTPPQMPSGDGSNQAPPQIPSGDVNNQTPPQMPSGNESLTPPGDLNQGNMQQPTESSSNTTTDSETASAKAIKCKNNMTINGGSFNIDSSDDSIHSNLNITINNGSINIASGDDGIHADSTVIINDGTIKITKSYEGIEGLVVDIAGGIIDIVASDDGINIAGGNDGSSVNGRVGQNQFAVLDNAYLNIKGGNVTIDSSGDGLDSNGVINLIDGNVVVYGPVNGADSAIDSNGAIKISGGNIIAMGSAEMVQNPSTESTQCSISITLDSYIDANKEVSLKDKDGNVIAAFTTKKQTQNIIISSPDIEQIKNYELYIGNNLEKEFSTTGIITSIGNRSFGGGRKQK